MVLNHFQVGRQEDGVAAARSAKMIEGEILVRIVVTHLSPFDGHKRALEASMLLHIANGVYLPDAIETSGPFHLWVDHWNVEVGDRKKVDDNNNRDRDRDTAARLKLPRGGRTTLGALITLGAQHRGVQGAFFLLLFLSLHKIYTVRSILHIFNLFISYSFFLFFYFLSYSFFLFFGRCRRSSVWNF